MVPHQHGGEVVIILNHTIRMAVSIVILGDMPKNPGFPLIQRFSTLDPLNHRVTGVKDALIFDMHRERGWPGNAAMATPITTSEFVAIVVHVRVTLSS